MFFYSIFQHFPSNSIFLCTIAWSCSPNQWSNARWRFNGEEKLIANAGWCDTSSNDAFTSACQWVQALEGIACDSGAFTSATIVSLWGINNLKMEVFDGFFLTLGATQDVLGTHWMQLRGPPCGRSSGNSPLWLIGKLN